MTQDAQRPSIVYVCGPRTGMPDENTPAIRGVAANLQKKGYIVINPVQINLNFLGTTYSPLIGLTQTYPGLRADIITLATACDGIALMPAWEKARGCRLEVALAITLGYTFVDYMTGEVVPRPASVTIDHGYHEKDPTKEKVE